MSVGTGSLVHWFLFRGARCCSEHSSGAGVAAQVERWDQGVFEPSAYTALAGGRRQPRGFAVLVATPDDTTISRMADALQFAPQVAPGRTVPRTTIARCWCVAGLGSRKPPAVRQRAGRRPRVRAGSH